MWKRDGPSAMMVSQNSAMLHSAHELRVPCDEDHTHIAKLKRTEASLYHIIKGHIQQALEKFEVSDNPLPRPGTRRPDFPFLENRSRGPSPGSKSPQWTAQDPVHVEVPELEGRRRIDASPRRDPTASQTNENSGLRVPIVQDNQGHEVDGSIPLKEVQNRKSRPVSYELEGPLTLLSSVEPFQHSPVDVSAQTSLAGPIPEVPAESKTSAQSATKLRSQSPNDRLTKVSSQYEEEFSDDLWDRESDASKYEIISTGSRGRSPKQSEYQPPQSAPFNKKRKDEIPTTTSARRASKDVFSMFKRKNSKPDPSEFLAAARDNDVKRMEELLAAGANLESKTSQNDNRTALHEAASLGHTDVAQFLLSAGAKKDAKTKSKSTPLHEAALEGSTDVARLLIRAGAQKEARNLDDSTALQLAAIRGHRDAVRLLVDYGANVHTTRIAGFTPLDDANTRGHKEVAQVLVRAGAAVRSRRSRLEDEQETQWPGLF